MYMAEEFDIVITLGKQNKTKQKVQRASRAHWCMIKLSSHYTDSREAQAAFISSQSGPVYFYVFL